MLYVDLSLPQIIGVTADRTIRHTGPVTNFANPWLGAYLDIEAVTTVKGVIGNDVLSGWPRRLSSFLRRLLRWIVPPGNLFRIVPQQIPSGCSAGTWACCL